MLTAAKRQIKKVLFSRVPMLRGSFPYFGTTVHFPHDSLLFRLACEQGIYEAENLRLLFSFLRPETFFFDVGSNIGLMSVPILARMSSVRVVSFEASPGVVPYLMKTRQQSPHINRWEVVPKAVGARSGKVRFSVSGSENSAFDGMKHTSRVPAKGEIEVDLTTLDSEWRSLGSPPVCAIKCDVEGAELEVLRGGVECIGKQRPFLLLEWNQRNLSAYGCLASALLDYACKMDFRVLAIPNLVPINSERELRFTMLITESFLLSPY